MPEHTETGVISSESLPRLNKRSLWIGNLGGIKTKAYFDMDRLITHAVLIGGSGTGKTIASMVLAEECLLKNVAVVVFDPTLEWTGFVNPCKDKGMLEKYEGFGLKESDARGFETKLIDVNKTDLGIKVDDFKKGEMTIFMVDRLTPNDYNNFMKNSFQSLFLSLHEQFDQLEILIVVENGYMLLPQFGGQGAMFLERACREFRKWGIGVILPTQIFSEFGAGVTGNVATEFSFSTRLEKDIQRASIRYGGIYSSLLPKLKVGECLVHNVNYNYTKPWRVDIRPILHDPNKLSRKEIEEYQR
jgi:DNA helicase HerA-like ATPase